MPARKQLPKKKKTTAAFSPRPSSNGSRARGSRNGATPAAAKPARGVLLEEAPAYLKQIAPSVRPEFVGASTLSTMLAAADPLTRDERILITRQALILIEQNYAHLPLKRVMHAVDPVQRLKLLLQELESDPNAFEGAGDLITHIAPLDHGVMLPSIPIVLSSSNLNE